MGLDWRVNQAEVVTSTLTGIRTPAVMWLSEESAGKRGLTAIDREGFEIHTAAGNDWLNGRLVQLGEPQDAPLLERALQRLDLLALGPDNLQYSVYPDRRAARDYAFRVDTALFQTLAAASGWKGTVPPPDVRGRLNIAFGWGARVIVKDWEDQALRVATLSNRAVGLLASPILTIGLVHRMPTGVLPYTGTGARGLYKRTGFGKRLGPRRSVPEPYRDTEGEEGSKPDFRLGASTPAPQVPEPKLGGSGVGTAPKVGTTEERAEINLDHRAATDVL